MTHLYVSCLYPELHHVIFMFEYCRFNFIQIIFIIFNCWFPCINFMVSARKSLDSTTKNILILFNKNLVKEILFNVSISISLFGLNSKTASWSARYLGKFTFPVEHDKPAIDWSKSAAFQEVALWVVANIQRAWSIRYSQNSQLQFVNCHMPVSNFQLPSQYSISKI